MYVRGRGVVNERIHFYSYFGSIEDDMLNFRLLIFNSTDDGNLFFCRRGMDIWLSHRLLLCSAALFYLDTILVF